MFNEFSHRHSDCFVDGVADKVILTRDSRSSMVFKQEYLFSGTFSHHSNVVPGSLVTNSESFLVQSVRQTTEKDRFCLMIKTNVEIDIQRWTQPLDVNDNPVGEPYFHAIETGIVGYARYVSGQLRQEDFGLLPTTVYVLILQTNVGIKPPTELDAPDRVVLNGHPYQADVIDNIKYPNLYYVQLSEDRR